MVRGDREMVLRRRHARDCHCNNYNYLGVLAMWQANMDIQAVVNSHHQVASYLLSHVAKDEKSEVDSVRAAVYGALGNLDPEAHSARSILISHRQAILSHRQVSKQECMFLLLSETLVSSRATVFVPASLPTPVAGDSASRAARSDSDQARDLDFSDSHLDAIRHAHGPSPRCLLEPDVLYEFASWFERESGSRAPERRCRGWLRSRPRGRPRDELQDTDTVEGPSLIGGNQRAPRDGRPRDRGPTQDSEADDGPGDVDEAHPEFWEPHPGVGWLRTTRAGADPGSPLQRREPPKPGDPPIRPRGRQLRGLTQAFLHHEPAQRGHPTAGTLHAPATKHRDHGKPTQAATAGHAQQIHRHLIYPHRHQHEHNFHHNHSRTNPPNWPTNASISTPNSDKWCMHSKSI